MIRPFDLLFTDLDGTLLDARSYSFEAARPALARVHELGIPLVICTSKTFAETLPLIEDLGSGGPCIVENGGAIYARPGPWGKGTVLVEFRLGGWERIDLGMPYSRLVEGLQAMRRQLGLSLIGFSDLTVEEVAHACGFTRVEASRAKIREFDEPFFIEQETPVDISRVEELARVQGMKVHRGGRFHHLTGAHDKGQAVEILLRTFVRSGGRHVSVGVGDSPNDLTMLKTVDVPVIVQRPTGRWDGWLMDHLPQARMAPGIGPQGWNRAILDLLQTGA